MLKNCSKYGSNMDLVVELYFLTFQDKKAY